MVDIDGDLTPTPDRGLDPGQGLPSPTTGKITPASSVGHDDPLTPERGPDAATRLDPTSVRGAGVDLGGTHLSLVTVNVGDRLFEVMDIFGRGVRELAHIAVEKYRRWFGKDVA